MASAKIKTRKSVELSSNNLERFSKHFGEGTSLSWYLDLLFTAAMDCYDEGFSPIDVGEAVAEKNKEELKDKLETTSP